MQESLHAGHRERLITKFVEYPDSFSDHELLEIFLFTVVPRKDTNALAHRLIQAFGDIKKVFSATAEQLMTVNGVGKTVAAQIVLHAKLMQKIAVTCIGGDKTVVSLDTIKKDVVSLFSGAKNEKFYFILLNDSWEVVFRMEFSGKDENSVFADTAEASHAMSAHKAKFAIMAHNHPSGNAYPSDADDIATSKFCVACNINGVNLIDHIIVAEKKVYSYFREKRLEYIKERTNFDRLI